MIAFFAIVIGFLRKSISIDHQADTNITISVLIAARNEENTLPRLLSDLKVQSYSPELFDIIIADDHSERKIESLLEDDELSLPSISVVELAESECGKKMALRRAAEKSGSELLVFIDADCRVGKDWVSHFAALYQQIKPGFIIGTVNYPIQRSILINFFRQEFISLVVTGIGTANLGFPTLCNGANMAVERNLYINSLGKRAEKHPGGDDVFLLHAIKRVPREIITCQEKKAMVTTQAPDSVGEFLNQRSRWASKAFLYKDFPTIILSLLVLITNIIFLFCLIQLIAEGYTSEYAIVVFCKIVTDYSVIIAGVNYFQGVRSLLWLPLFQLIYPLYLIISLILGIFGFYRWKGRKY